MSNRRSSRRVSSIPPESQGGESNAPPPSSQGSTSNAPPASSQGSTSNVPLAGPQASAPTPLAQLTTSMSTAVQDTQLIRGPRGQTHTFFEAVQQIRRSVNLNQQRNLMRQIIGVLQMTSHINSTWHLTFLSLLSDMPNLLTQSDRYQYSSVIAEAESYRTTQDRFNQARERLIRSHWFTSQICDELLPILMDRPTGQLNWHDMQNLSNLAGRNYTLLEVIRAGQILAMRRGTPDHRTGLLTNHDLDTLKEEDLIINKTLKKGGPTQTRQLAQRNSDLIYNSTMGFYLPPQLARDQLGYYENLWNGQLANERSWIPAESTRAAGSINPERQTPTPAQQPSTPAQQTPTPAQQTPSRTARYQPTIEDIDDEEDNTPLANRQKKRHRKTVSLSSDDILKTSWRYNHPTKEEKQGRTKRPKTTPSKNDPTPRKDTKSPDPAQPQWAVEDARSLALGLLRNQIEAQMTVEQQNLTLQSNASVPLAVLNNPLRNPTIAQRQIWNLCIDTMRSYYTNNLTNPWAVPHTLLSALEHLSTKELAVEIRELIQAIEVRQPAAPLLNYTLSILARGVGIAQLTDLGRSDLFRQMRNVLNRLSMTPADSRNPQNGQFTRWLTVATDPCNTDIQGRPAQVNIHLNDLWRLLPQQPAGINTPGLEAGWLSDDNLNTILLTHLRGVSRGSTWVVPAASSDWLIRAWRDRGRRGGQERLEDALNNHMLIPSFYFNGPNRIGDIVIPINVNSNHWALIYIRAGAPHTNDPYEIFVMDSTYNRRTRQQLFQFAEYWMHERRWFFPDGWRRNDARSAQDKSGVHCGVYLIENAIALERRQALPNPFRQENQRRLDYLLEIESAALQYGHIVPNEYRSDQDWIPEILANQGDPSASAYNQTAPLPNPSANPQFQQQTYASVDNMTSQFESMNFEPARYTAANPGVPAQAGGLPPFLIRQRSTPPPEQPNRSTRRRAGPPRRGSPPVNLDSDSVGSGREQEDQPIDFNVRTTRSGRER